MTLKTSKEIKNEIFQLTADYYNLKHKPKEFIPGKTHVPVSGRVYTDEDMKLLIDSALKFWLTTGKYNNLFESELGKFLGVKHVLTVNSGSSANLVAFAALTSELLEDRALKPGDEVISVAAGFPTTVNPILQYGCIPVFVDVDIPTYNIDITKIEAAITSKTKAIMLAHTLGNPYNLEKITEIAKKYNLWLIEDSCDALGSTYNGQKVGTFGDIGTLSFYPAHHITMGEGGAVFTNNDLLRRILESIRDWGRDCWCLPGCDNTCGKRFNWQLGELPFGYDHKYIYSHLGYNLKITDMQAAVGVAQLKHLNGFIEKRKQNFKKLHEGLSNLTDYFILPKATENSDPSWFGFPMTIKKGVKFSRKELMEYLGIKNIGTRLIFAGNLTKQPYMLKQKYKIHKTLDNTDIIMNDSFWIGVFPGITEEMINYIIDSFKNFVEQHG
jgi:CDP-6-deoxy-D-xylo-4-hexulose-3-dehydrase